MRSGTLHVGVALCLMGSFQGIPAFSETTIPAIMEICDNGIDDDGDGLIDYFDPDCCGRISPRYYHPCPEECNIVLGDAFDNIVLKYATAEGFFHEGSTPLVGDLDQDGCIEIVGLQGSYNPTTQLNESRDIVIFDGATGDVILRFDPGFKGPFSRNLAIADTDGDGFAEIYSNITRLIRFDYDGVNLTKVWEADGDRHTQPTITDINEDGRAEIMVGSTIYDAASGTILVAPGQIVENGKARYQGSASTAMAIDVLPDQACSFCGGKEIVAGSKVYAVQINGLTPAQTSLERQINDTLVDGLTSIVDWDMDGDLDAVSCFSPYRNGISRDSKEMWVWDIQSSTLLAPVYRWRNHQWSSVSPVTLGDTDGDGQPEAVVSDLAEIRCVEYQNGQWVEKFIFDARDGTGMAGIVLFDFDLDGRQEIVYRDEHELFIFDGGNGDVLFRTPCTSLTGYETPSIADVDGDQQAELLCACGNNLHVYESATSSWALARPVWNQLVYYGVHIEDDLTLPQVQQAPHLIPDGSMNMFFGQYAYGNYQDFNLLGRFIDFNCSENWVEYHWEVCNQGLRPTCGLLSQAVFSQNPGTATDPADSIIRSSISIPPGQCQSFVYRTARGERPQFIGVNIDQRRKPPLPLNESGSLGGFFECNYEDNIIELPQLSLPDLPNLGPDTSICDIESYILSLPSGYVRYIWENGSSDSVRNIRKSGLYYVEVEDECGSIFHDSVSLRINDSIPTAAFFEICKGDSLLYKNTWWKEGGVFEFLQEVDGCDSLVRLEIAELESPEFELPDTINVTYGIDTIIEPFSWVSSQTGFQFQWRVTNHSSNCSNCYALELLQVKEDGFIDLVVSNGICSQIISVFIQTRKRIYDFYLPNAFSPNGDNINDNWKFFGNDENVWIESLDIFDRWGELVFTSSNTLAGEWDGWDGRFNGNLVQDGVYVVHAHLMTSNDERITLAQDISVIR